MSAARFAIHISTKNRKADLLLTLEKIEKFIAAGAECVVFDDGSTDGTSEAVRKQFPAVQLKRNNHSRGYLYCRNAMLNESTAEFVVSLDDDAHFVSVNPLDMIAAYFDENPKCGLIAFRIYWGIQQPPAAEIDEKPIQVNGFVGCGHVWRLSAWREIPDYPEWFRFYGEEHFASLHLFKNKLRVDYLPQILVHHRVDMQSRKADMANAYARFRNSLYTGWCNYFLFYPVRVIPRKMAYSVKAQMTQKILNGRPKLLLPMISATVDLVRNAPKLVKHRRALTVEEYLDYMKLHPAKIFWNP